MRELKDKIKLYFKLPYFWSLDDVIHEYSRQILLVIVLGLIAINSSVFMIVYKYFHVVNANISEWYSFLFVLSMCLEILGGIILIRQKENSPDNTSISDSLARHDVPDGYINIFSQVIDPIGELHIWCTENNRFLIDNSNIDDLVPTQEQISLSNGIRQVILLEEFLSRHCNLEIIGRYGISEPFNPNLHAMDESFELKIAPKSGESVTITSPGWCWGKTVIRYPRVK